MSYEDLKEVRAKRAAKEKATAGKGKRGCKRESPALEAEVEAGLSMLKDKVARISEVELAKALVALWRAPVARIY
jgi:hypothetical protein